MRQSEKGMELQGSENAKNQLQKELSKLTKEFHGTFDYCDIQLSLTSVLTGWLSSQHIEQTPSNERINIFGFLSEIQNHFQETTRHNKVDQTGIFPYEIYEPFFCYDLKRSKKYLKEVLTRFLESEFADHKELRQDVVYQIDFIKKYIKKIQLLNLQNRN